MDNRCRDGRRPRTTPWRTSKRSGLPRLTPAAKTRPPTNPVRRVTLIVIAIGAVLFFYGIAADRYTPYTAQGLVQAYLVRIAPKSAAG